MIHARTFRGFFVLLASLALLVACRSDSTPTAATSKSVRISNKDFTEQLILSAMIEITLTSQGFQVTNAFRPKLSTTEVRNALIQAEIDMYPEYTGTALTTLLNVTDRQTVGGPGSIDAVRALDLQQNHIVWGAPTTFNNTWAYALRKDFATSNNVKSLSDLIAYAKGHAGIIKFLSSNEFYKRENDGVRAMLAFYGASELEGDILIPYPDDKNGTVYKFFDEKKDTPAPPEYAVMVFGTDSQVAQYKLVVMDDDKKFWPYYAAAVTARQELVDKYPDVMKGLDAFMPLLDAATMPELNRQVDFDNKTPHDVALAWLQSKGFQK